MRGYPSPVGPSDAAVEALWSASALAAAREALSLDTSIVCEGEPTTWGAFVRANAEGLTSAEIAEAGATLAAGRSYTGGGGAGADWTIAPAVAS